MNEAPTDCGLCRHLVWLSSIYMERAQVLVRCEYENGEVRARIDALGQVEPLAWCPLRRVPA